MDHLNGEEFTGANVRYERGAEVRNPFRQSSREVMIKDTAIKPKGSGHDIV
jgi:hypothetical protein